MSNSARRMFNGLAGGFLALYLASVAYRGNAVALGEQIKTETGFVKWALALFALAMIHAWSSGSVRKFVGGVAGVTFLTLLIRKGPDVAEQVNNFFK